MKVLRPTITDRRPKVSVIIAHYNYGRFLPDAVRSATEQQAGVDVEVVIVDDRSTDGSDAVARSLASGDPRIQLVEHTVNMQHIRTYNDGLSRATGDYVVLLSADDMLAPHSLVRAVSLMEANPRVSFVYGRVAWFHDEPPTLRHSRSWWQIWTGEEWIARVVARGRNAIASPEVVMRRSVSDSIGGYDAEFPHAGDMYMWLQAAARGDVGFIGGPAQGCYRVHGSNMHTEDFGGIVDDSEQVISVYRRFLLGEGERFSQHGALIAAASRSVAREAVLRATRLMADGAPAESVAPLLAHAVEIDPAVNGSAVSRWRRLAQDRRALRGVIRRTEALRWKIRSRRDELVGL